MSKRQEILASSKSTENTNLYCNKYPGGFWSRVKMRQKTQKGPPEMRNGHYFQMKENSLIHLVLSAQTLMISSGCRSIFFFDGSPVMMSILFLYPFSKKNGQKHL